MSLLVSSFLELTNLDMTNCFLMNNIYIFGGDLQNIKNGTKLF